MGLVLPAGSFWDDSPAGGTVDSAQGLASARLAAGPAAGAPAPPGFSLPPDEGEGITLPSLQMRMLSRIDAKKTARGSSRADWTVVALEPENPAH